MFIAEKKVIRLEVDFSKVENQIIGVIDLPSLPENFVLQHVLVQRIDALPSSGAATIMIGNAAAATGYVAADVRAQTLKDVVEGKGSLVYDSVNKVHTPYPVLAANVVPKVTVAVAAITSGRVALYLEGFFATQH